MFLFILRAAYELPSHAQGVRVFAAAEQFADTLVQTFAMESQNLKESSTRLLDFLSDQLSCIEKQINTSLLRGEYPPKKLNQWAMEARALKRQVLDVLPKLKNEEGELEEMAEIHTKIVNHLKICPSMDDMKYGKQILDMLTHDSGSDKSSTRFDQKHKTEVLTQEKTDQSLNTLQGKDIATVVDERGRKPTPTSECKRGSESVGETSSQQIQHCFKNVIPTKEHYSVIVKDDRVEIELDQQTILIGDRTSLGPPEISSVNVVRNLAEQDLRKLSEKPANPPNSLVLLLQRNYRLTMIHSSFFDSMSNLIFLDLSDTRIRILPTSLFGLSKLKVLMLRNCASLGELPSEIGKLGCLEVLDLLGTELYNLPDEIGRLILLRHLQLSFYGPDDESEYALLPSKLISQKILSKLKALEAISIIVHPKDHRWTEIAEGIMKDITSLDKLSSIQLYFPKVEFFVYFIEQSPSWHQQRLRKFKFIVGRNVKQIASRVPHEVESMFHQHYQCLRFVNGDEISEVIKTVLRHVKAFYLDHHIRIQCLSEFGINNFQVLKFCVVRECPKIQSILDEKQTESAFPSLEHLGVYYLWQLEHIWKSKSPLPAGSFQVLKYLIFNTCPKLKYILWKSVLRCLLNLEELVVDDCAGVEKIIEDDENKLDYNSMELPKLRKLVLRYLPNLVTLGNGLFLSEEVISTDACPKLVLPSK